MCDLYEIWLSDCICLHIISRISYWRWLFDPIPHQLIVVDNGWATWTWPNCSGDAFDAWDCIYFAMACSPTNSDLMLRWRWLAKQVIWNEYRWGELASVEQPHGRRLERAQFNVEWPLVSLIQSANSNHWVLGTTNRILRAGLILLMAMPIEEETCMYDGEWHLHASQVADESTRTSPSGEMNGMDLMQEGEDYDGLGRTSSCSYLWMMSWCFFFSFSQIGFYNGDWLQVCYGLSIRLLG